MISPSEEAAMVQERVDSPAWYQGGVETIEKIETVVDGLPAKQAYLLGQIIRYCDRAGLKDEVSTDLGTRPTTTRTAWSTANGGTHEDVQP